jgi:hypothetical protein
MFFHLISVGEKIGQTDGHLVGTGIAPALSVPILFIREYVCSGESSEEPDPEFATKFGLLVGKLNACLNHLEQFPIKVIFLTKRAGIFFLSQ